MFQIECTFSSVAVISIWWLILFSSSCQKVRVQGFHRHLGKSWQNIVSNPRRTLTFSAWGIQSIHSVPFSFPSDIDPSAPRQSCAVSLPKKKTQPNASLSIFCLYCKKCQPPHSLVDVVRYGCMTPDTVKSPLDASSSTKCPGAHCLWLMLPTLSAETTTPKQI